MQVVYPFFRKKDRKSRTGITDQTRRNTGKSRAGTGESSVSKGIGRTRGRTTFYGSFRIKRGSTFYDGNFQKRSGRCTENLDTGTWIFQCHRGTVFGTHAGTIFGRKIQHGLPAHLCRWWKWNSAGGCTNQTDHGLF